MLFFGLCLLISSFGIISALELPSTTYPSKVIILLGPPGSGKGTQAVRLSKELNIPHISTGDLFRENLSKGTELGKKAKSFIEAGRLVPDEVVLDMLFDRVSRPDCANGYLLDGFPRTIPQAEAFGKHLDSRTKIIALNLNVEDDTIVKRIAGRLTCKNCGNIQQKSSNTEHADACHKCGGELYQRTDDKAEVVKERLRVYHEQTEPLIHFYEKQGVLFEINGENTPDQVFQDLLKAYQESMTTGQTTR